MSTFPLGNNVAVCPALDMVMLPMAENVPIPGSYSSALAIFLPPQPPAMSTFPLGNNVAVSSSLATVMLPVGTKTPCGIVVPAAPAELVTPAELVASPAAPVVPPELVAPPVPPVVSPELVASPVVPVVPAAAFVSVPTMANGVPPSPVCPAS